MISSDSVKGELHGSLQHEGKENAGVSYSHRETSEDPVRFCNRNIFN
jgi:hypothetical protein